MKLFKVDDLVQQFIDEVDRIEGGKDSDVKKRADLSGKAKAYAFLFDLALNGVPIVALNGVPIAGAHTEKKEVSK
jgi:hypothetical protein